MSIAWRTIVCKYNEVSTSCEIFVGAPSLQNGLWTCEYGLNSDLIYSTRRQIIGEDSLQALQLAICMLNNLLEESGASEFTWESLPDLGLPRSVRDYALGNLDF